MIEDQLTLDRFGYLPSDWSEQSHKSIVGRCDYCNEVYETRKQRLILSRKTIAKDCCFKCRFIKNQEICKLKYGDIHPAQTDEVKKRRKNTVIKKYGVDHISRSEIVQNKKKETNLKRYGREYAQQTDSVKQKIIQTNIDKYGAAYGKIGSTKTQNQIGEWLLNKFNLEFKSDHKILNGKEIDLYNDGLKLGIEYCGLYWHTEGSVDPKTRSYHYDKYKKCKDKKIRLITIFGDEWLYKQKQVKSFLRSIISKNYFRVGARECIVKQVSFVEAKQFLEDNHIQGIGRAALVYFGIYYENILLGIMSVSKHHRQLDQLIINRLCFKDGYTIMGGASKLFQSIRDWMIKNSYSVIYTWSDNRWSYCNIYKKLGFNCIKSLAPDYSYVNFSKPKERISKQKMKKKNINCPNDITEKDFLQQQNTHRIWDCGKMKWKYKL